MELSIFLEKLRLLSFDKKELIKSGFEDGNIKDFDDSFKPTRKHYKSKSNDILIKFIEEYENTIILVSNISFEDELEYSDKYVLWGRLSAENPLAIYKLTNEIVTLSSNYGEDNIVFYCAENSEKFLEAFLIHGIGPLDIEFSTEQELWAFNLARAEKAAKAAGGEKYYEFWRTLYPVEDYKSKNPNEYGFLN
jgi:hypothetical protein